MQFLAFLQDSYREAKSGWMLQIMLVLSGLLLLLVASIGFRPATLEDHVGEQLQFMTSLLRYNPAAYAQLGEPVMSIESVKATNKAQPWKSDYEFDYVVTCPTPADMRKAVKSGLPTTHQGVQNYVRDSLREYYTKVDVDELPEPPELAAFYAVGGGLLAGDPPVISTELRYHVRASGNKVDDQLAWPHKISVLFAWDLFDNSLRDGVYIIEKYLVSYVAAWVLVFIGVIITAGSIPTMLAKGSLDLLISKPIGRSRLFIYKYIGGLTFVFLLTTFTVVGIWVIIGLRSGIWTSNFLVTIPIVTFYFSVLYSVSALTAMLTRNTLVAILMTILFWAGLWVVGKVNNGVENRLQQEIAAKERKGLPIAPKPPKDDESPDADDPMAGLKNDKPLWGFIPKSTFPFVRALHAVTPRTYQIDERLSRVIAEGALSPNQLKRDGYDKAPKETWGELIGVSLAFIAVMLGLGCWRFETRDN